MFFTYDKESKHISPCDETEFNAHGLTERRDIESWIIERPELLGEDLYVLTTEYDQFDKTDERLDILCLDRAGN